MKPLLIALLVTSLTAAAQEPSVDAPRAWMQILNGIAPHPVDVSINEKVKFTGLAPGTRMSSAGMPSTRIEVKVRDTATSAEKTFEVNLTEGRHHTMVLTGDFAPVPSGPDASDKDVRVFCDVSVNDRNVAGDVRVRIFNGMTDAPVEIGGSGVEPVSVAPLKSSSVSGRADNLALKAACAGASRMLYLAQQAPVRNIAIVFYPVAGGFQFRAMTENSSEAIEAENTAATATE